MAKGSWSLEQGLSRTKSSPHRLKGISFNSEDELDWVKLESDK